jgi:hypothetical protein
MAGGGGEGTRAALPMPEGSLSEPLGPRAFAGPGGMPLTPASWAGDVEGSARTQSSATVTAAVLPQRHDRERNKTSCARVMRCPLPECASLFTGRNGEQRPEFQGNRRNAGPTRPHPLHRTALFWSNRGEVWLRLRRLQAQNPPAALMPLALD